MFDSSLKPGLSLGLYPQRWSQTPNFAERTFKWLKDQKDRQTLPTTRAQLAAKVDAAASHLNELTDIQLGKEWHQLRDKLNRFGLCPSSIFLSFALLREIAERETGKRFYDTQLLGGWTIMTGRIAEMETGQGKSFTCVLPACTAALAGIPVHVFTANDYLAQRDEAEFRSLYRRLGLSSAAVYDGQPLEERQAAYESDIVHSTAPQIAFDYLRDRREMSSTRSDKQLQLRYMQARHRDQKRPFCLRGLCFAIVDEIDSVLIDEASTPLILSATRQEKARQRQFCDALYLAKSLEKTVDYTTDLENRKATLTEAGSEKLTTLVDVLDGFWKIRRQREFLVTQGLQALHLYQRDEDYIVRDGRVMIVDPLTGRVMPDRSWQQGLHQLIEAKEGCEVTSEKDPLARITFQTFFRRYLFMAGMSGTVTECSAEIWKDYGLTVTRIPPHQSNRRHHFGERLYLDNHALRHALISTLKQRHNQGQPVLIGTRTIAESEKVSDWCHQASLPHQLLNAHQDYQEAQLIGQAGNKGAITIATNMAGRGTDISISKEAAQLGGLHVICIGRNTSHRLDRQLIGRCARQGDPGSAELMSSLDDEQLKAGYTESVLTGLRKLFIRPHDALPAWLSTVILAIPQIQKIHYDKRHRQRMKRHEEQLQRSLAFSGRQE